MKKITFLSATFMIITMLSGCYEEGVRPAGETTTIAYEFTDFNAISISDAFNVELINEEVDPHVEIIVDVNLTPYLNIFVHRDRLYIGLEEHVSVRGNAVQHGTIYVNSEIRSLQVSGASYFIISDTLNADELRMEISGASQLISPISTTNLTAQVSGASTISLSGEATYVELDVSGASLVQGYDLIVDNVNMELSGASNSLLTVIDALSVEASGASTVRYKGNPVILRSELSGASSLIQVD